ncbi:MAG: CYTH domain-containing protein [Microbacteriaceae bacterium]|nr:CYTH domain-containing protein [Microbacteriaceae bacterium]
MLGHLEIELKFEVPADAELPYTWPCDLTAGATADVQLVAEYYDTLDGKLAQHGIAVRRREGGGDAGWHLKRRVNSTTQQEAHWPLAPTLPGGLRQEIEKLVPEAGAWLSEMRPIARITTERQTTLLHSKTGTALYEIADDRVLAEDLRGGVRRAWREWEAEAVTSETCHLAEIAAALQKAGAVPSLAGSKIARAASALLPQAAAKNAPAETLAALAIQDLADTLAASQPAEPTAEERIARLRAIAINIAG